jgi:hypothetical protein
MHLNLTDNLVYDRYVVPGGQQNLHIYPGGGLVAILVTKRKNADDMLFVLVDSDDPVHIFHEFTVPAELTCGGKLFNPLPNVNSAHGYVLMIPDGSPEMEILSINRRMDYGSPA